ncbi:SMYD2 [Branchiostoma lanceolatum]|uniref:[histone H3]-lysine(4) N-trimethyltransferase n=1 Tax=Branchiostoma lanceolatum TaxID=7740 RepID=A0A8K0EDA5_BRALA|nr:SMYD2 [Branchiostoma lanceolatum]
MLREHVEIFLSPDKGRGLRCKKNGPPIKAGTLIIEEDSYCFTLLEGQEEKRCHYCLEEQSPKLLLTCPKCLSAKYCDEECQRRPPPTYAACRCPARANFPCKLPAVPPPVAALTVPTSRACPPEAAHKEHLSECDGYRRLMKLPFHLRLLGRILYRQSTRKYEQGALGPLSDLCSHIEELKDSTELKTQLQKLSRNVNEDILPDRDQLEILYGKTTCNCFSIHNLDLGEIGVGMYPQAAMMNHSCKSNCVVTYRGPRLQIRALVDIQPGEEVYHSYAEKGHNTRERRDELSKYFFECQCSHCLDTDRDGTMMSVKCPSCRAQVKPNSNERYVKCSSCGYTDFSAEFYEDLEVYIQYADDVNHKPRVWATDILFTNIVKNCLVELDKILHPDNIHTVRILGGAFAAAVKLEEWAKAINYGKRLERVFVLYLPPNEPDIGLLYYKMGKAYYHLDDLDNALASFRKAKKMLGIAYGRDSQLADYAQEWLELCGDYGSSSEEDETDINSEIDRKSS